MTDFAPVEWSKVPLPQVILGLARKGTYYSLRSAYHPGWLPAYATLWPRHWHKKSSAWEIPMGPGVLEQIKKVFGTHLIIDQDALAVGKRQAAEKEATEILKIQVEQGVEIPLPEGIKFYTEPYKHQRHALAMCLQRKAFGLLMEMGTGKTKVILDMIAELKRQSQIEVLESTQLPGVENVTSWEPTLILCPVAVLENWARQTLIHQPYLKAVPLLHGNSLQKATLLHSLRTRNAADIIVCNYETAWRIQDEFKRYYWSAVVLDESTRIKARGSKQAKGALKIGAWGRRRYILTGTPMPNSPLELFNQIKFLDPTVLGPNFYGFRDRYAIMGGYQGYQVIGWKNLDELSKQLMGITYSVKKKDCLDLPEKVYKEYRFPMPPSMEPTYRAMAETLVAELQGATVSVDVVLAKLTKLRLITSGFMYNGGDVLRLTSNPKLDKCMEIIDDMVGEHKIVIWTMFTEELDALEKALAEGNSLRVKEGREAIASVRLDGASKNRGEIIRKFQEDPGVRIFLGQQEAGGIGIDLFAGDYCIFFSNDYSPETRLQAEDRLHRIGQKNTVTYVDLLMKGTIDVGIKATLARKAKITAIVEGNGLKEMIYGAASDTDGDGPGEAVRGGEEQG